MDRWTFALPSNLCDFSVKKEAKKVCTKRWARLYASKLGKYADKLTNANRDDVQIVGGMLQAAYGANIGRQIEEQLKPSDFIKIRENILEIVYK